MRRGAGVPLHALGLVLLLVPAGQAPGAQAVPPSGEVAPEREAQYRSEGPKSVLELQPWRTTEHIERAPGEVLTLVDLHPETNEWYALLVADAGSRRAYHLENARPEQQRLGLDPGYPDGLVLVTGSGARRCPLWAGGDFAVLDDAQKGMQPYTSLCDGALYLRNPVRGRRSSLERAAELFRDHIWGGERIITRTRELLLEDRYLERGERSPSGTGAAPAAGAPSAARLAPGLEQAALGRGGLGVRIEADAAAALTSGRWYAARAHRGIYVSLVEPGTVAPPLLAPGGGSAGALDAVEREALVYLLAFDLGRYEIGFSLGTDHPRLGWSQRPPVAVRRAALPGPDGFDDAYPLVRTGTVTPAQRERVAATFIGGFKRTHGAFKYGRLASLNRGSHYGFVQSGVVLSTPQPGLASLIVRAGGAVEMATWTRADPAALAGVRHVRQNGVALVEPGPDGVPLAGALVGQWGAGNWSGSHDMQLRTMRAGACLQSSGAGRFLLYAVFTSARPVAMARVFQAYGCSYAMLLDMNALEHTYSAVYGDGSPASPAVQHLIEGMGAVDPKVGGEVVPRFLGAADNRDFFYVARRSRH